MENEMKLTVKIAEVTLQLTITGNVLALEPGDRRRACRLVDVFKEAANGVAKTRKPRKARAAGEDGGLLA